MSLNQASVTVAGSTSSSPVDTIQARFIPIYGGADTGWVSIGTTASFSGSVTVTGGWYDLQVRALSSGVIVTTGYLNGIGVGDIFLIAGQSNAGNIPADTPGVTSAGIFQRRYNDNTDWVAGTDPQRDATDSSGGSMWTRMSNAMVASTGVPIALVDVAVGSTVVADWLPASGTAWPKLGAAATSLGTGFRCVLWAQGETDTDLNTSQADYEARLELVIDGVRSNAGWSVPWYIATDTRITNAWSPVIEAAQHNVATTYANCFSGADLDSLDASYRLDGTHFNDTGLLAAGNLWKALL